MPRKPKPPLTAEELRNDVDLYGRYCAKITLRVQANGRAAATHLFVLTLNPKYRGPNFRWSYLEDEAAEYAVTMSYSGFTDREWNTFKALIKEDAAHSARLTIRELLKDSGVETWLPLPPSSSSSMGGTNVPNSLSLAGHQRRSPL